MLVLDHGTRVRDDVDRLQAPSRGVNDALTDVCAQRQSKNYG